LVLGYVWAGLLSREMCDFGVPTLSHQAEGHVRDGVIREPSWDPARSENLGTHGVSMRENREIPWSPAGVGDAPSWMVRGVAYRRLPGRGGNAEAVIPR
jgi:hypothetical protein